MQRIKFDRQANKDNKRQFNSLSNLGVETVEGKNRIQGYVVVWDKLSGDQGGFVSSFAKGGMVAPDYPVVLLYNHNSDWQLASEQNNSLAFEVDDVGLRVSATLDDTFIDNYVAEKMKSGVISGMSVGMYPIKVRKESRVISVEDAEGNSELKPFIGQSVPVEVFDQWLLDEITITGRPAFPQCSVELFSKDKGNEQGNTEIEERELAEFDLLLIEMD